MLVTFVFAKVYFAPLAIELVRRGE